MHTCYVDSQALARHSFSTPTYNYPTCRVQTNRGTRETTWGMQVAARGLQAGTALPLPPQPHQLGVPGALGMPRSGGLRPPSMPRTPLAKAAPGTGAATEPAGTALSGARAEGHSRARAAGSAGGGGAGTSLRAKSP